MEALQILSRSEMKIIKAGVRPCGVLYDGEWDCGLHLSEAQAIYDSVPGVSAYCCASCGEEGFLSSPC